jgi:glucan phosphoethanolaminetransferase (alkaline phosphatase superfamily)
MRTLIARLALLAMWLFLLSPMLLYPLWGNGRASIDMLYFFNLVASVLWVGVLHFAVRSPFKLHMLLAPLYITTAIDLFLLGVFGNRLSSGFVFVALTDSGEAGEFFGAYTRPVLFTAAALIGVYILGMFAIRRLRLQSSRKLSFGCAVLLMATYAAVFVRDSEQGFSFAQSTQDIVAKEMSAPMGGVFQIGVAMQIFSNNMELKREREVNRLNGRPLRSNENEIYVWVIGESSRPQDWSIFGYPRDTNPRLSSMPGVIPLSDMLTTAPLTSVAVPSMLSLRPITDWNSVLGQRSIVSAFNDAGFTTYWFSCQEADSWAGFNPVIAAEAKHRQFFDRALDYVLLNEFRSALAAANPGQKLFFVLHTKGSHFEYSRRYPPEFAHFNSASGTRRAQLVDSYDNSVLYTDWLVSEVIATLAATKAPSALIYASDHGENLLDTDAHLLGHAIGNQFDLPTAALLWLSEPLRARLPDMAVEATAHSGAKLSLSNLPHSLLDLAGIEAKGFDPSMSIFSPEFHAKERWYMVRGELHKEPNSLLLAGQSGQEQESPACTDQRSRTLATYRSAKLFCLICGADPICMH